MDILYKVDFNNMDWETPVEGVREKYCDYDGQRIRLVEYTQDLPPHWCEKGHCGYLISGELEIEYPDRTIVYNQGEGINIPDGPIYKHKGRVLSDKALVFFIENA